MLLKIIIIIIIVIHKLLLDCNELIVTHKLMDSNEMIVINKLLDCNEVVAMGTDDCYSQIYCTSKQGVYLISGQNDFSL